MLQTKTFSYGDLSYKSYSNAYLLELTVTEESVDRAANTSLLSYELRLRSGKNNRFSLYHIGAEVTFDGETVATRNRYTTAQVSLGYSSAVTLLTGSVTVHHAENGGKTLQIGYSIDMEPGNYVPGPLTSSGEMILTPIPRCAVFTASGGTLGQPLTFTFSDGEPGQRYTLSCRAGDFSETLFENRESLTEFTWTPPLSWAAANTRGTSVQLYGELECLGAGKNGAYIPCAIPESVVPGCAITLSDGAGFCDTYGYIRGKSRLGVAVTPQPACGAAITDVTVTANGGVYTGCAVDAGAVKAAGQQKVTVQLTDTRGRKGTVTAVFTVLDYANPVLSGLTAARCNADGSENDRGEYVKLTFSAAVSPLEGKNTAAYTLSYRKTGAAGFTGLSLSDFAGQYTVSGGSYILPADSASSYELRLTVADAIGESSASVMAPTGFTLMHWTADGRGMGIGKMAEASGCLDMGLPIRMNGGRISGLPLPESAGEAVSKAYADSLVIPVQNVPEFANTIEECVDKTKLYVLPDGFLYGYILTVIEPYTNRIPGSVDAAGEAVGLMANKRYNSSGLLRDSSDGHKATGYIAAIGKQVVRLRGVTFNTAMAFADSSYIWFYDGGFNKVNGFSAAAASPGSAYGIARDGDGNIVEFTVPDGVNIAYITLCSPGMDENSIVTVDQEITGEEAVHTYAWASTGHAFVPADYESRILALETGVNDLALRVGAIQIPEVEGPPDYVLQEAQRVAKAVASVQNGGSVTLLCYADLHHFPADPEIEAALRHAGQGGAALGRQAVVDGVLILGDCIYGTTESQTEAAAALLQLGELLHDAVGERPCVWVPGNHDCIPQGIMGSLSPQRQFALIGRRSRSVRWSESPVLGCGVLDLGQWGVRVICLNTADIGDIRVDNSSMESYGMSRISAAQLAWLRDTLADTPAGWTVLLGGHHPLDWPSGVYTDGNGVSWQMNVQNAATLLQAYQDGSAGEVSVDGEAVSFDFAGKNGAVIAAQLHGHVHNYATGLLSGTDIPRIAIPNALPERDNSAYDGYQEEVTYPKTPGTARDTAFCAVTLDTENRRIYAHHYGAGYDREISY